ncbi:MAG: MATE family efflux transporter [Neglectibacter sp.]
MQKVDLLEGSIVRSLTSLALPIMATSLIQMAYNMTDMIWIGRVSANAVAAVGAAGMYLWLANGLAMIPPGRQVKWRMVGAQNIERAALMGRRHSISGPCWWFCLQRFVSHSTGR